MADWPDKPVERRDLTSFRELASDEKPDFAGYHDDIARFYAYWDEKRGQRSMPARRDIDPLEIGYFLPGVALIDVVPDARRFVYRLMGTRSTMVRGSDPTGKPVVEAFYAPSAADSMQSYNDVCHRAAPRVEQRYFLTPDGRPGHEECITLPLSNDGVTVNMILCYTYHLLD